MPRERAAEKGPERPPAAGPLDSRSLRLSPGARAPPGRRSCAAPFTSPERHASSERGTRLPIMRATVSLAMVASLTGGVEGACDLLDFEWPQRGRRRQVVEVARTA